MIVYLNVPTRQSSQKRWPQTVWTGFLIATRQIEQVWPGDSLSTNTKSYPPYRGSVIFNTIWIFSAGDSCCTCSSDGGNICSIIEAKAEEQLLRCRQGGVRHDPPRFMGRIVAVVTRSSSHIRERWIKPRDQYTASFPEKHYGRGRFGGFSRPRNACYWLHKAISMSLSWFGDDRRSILSILFSQEDFMYCFVYISLYVYVYLRSRVKVICSSYLDLLN